jgi:hypothetical protein
LAPENWQILMYKGQAYLGRGLEVKMKHVNLDKSDMQTLPYPRSNARKTLQLNYFEAKS